MSVARRLRSPLVVFGLTTLAGCGLTEPPGASVGSTVVEPLHIVEPAGVAVGSDLARTAVDFVRSTGTSVASYRDDWRVRRVAHGLDGRDHVRLDQVYDGLRVWGADVVVHADDVAVRGASGTVVREIGDLVTVPDLAAADALALARAIYADSVPDRAAPLAYEREATELVVVPVDGGKPRLAWHTVFFTELQAGAEPGLWNALVAADDGTVLERWNAIHHLSQASGPGGNPKVDRTWVEALDVEPAGSQFQMSTSDLVTINMNNRTSGGTVVVAPLDGFNDPVVNDAHGFAELTLKMMQEWYGHDSIDDNGFVIRSRVHYSSNYDNAFWDGQQMTYGDGATLFYPLTGDLDVVAHEINHGFTSRHSNLIYSNQSGGNNEAFSDIAGALADFYFEGDEGEPGATGGDFDVGRNVWRADGSMRYMCDPPLDGRGSIGHASDYVPGMNVHLSSGVMNKAFCRAAKRISSGTPDGRATRDGVKRTGAPFYLANDSYWTANSNFVQACQGVLDAARALGFTDAERAALRDSFSDVGVACDGAPPPPPPPPTCNETLTAGSGTLSSPNHPGQYPNNYSRTWCIRPASGSVATLSFGAFATELNYDFVTITDGVTGAQLSRTSGNTAPAPQSSSFLVVKFTTDGSVTGTGWQASWTSDGPPPPNEAPTVAITAPAGGSTVSGTITITATAADVDGTVASVTFQLPDGTSVVDTSAPYSTPWNTATVANGSHTIRATAVDDDGASSAVATSAVTVSNGGGGGCVNGTYNSTDVPKAIPDNTAGGVLSALPITGEGVVSSLRLSLNVSHPTRSNLKVTLIGPTGIEYVAHNRTGVWFDNLVIVDRIVRAFDNRQAPGSWQLRVEDLAGGDTGQLNSWSLKIVGRCN